MEWGKQNKYHSEIMTILGCSAAETVSYVPQHWLQTTNLHSIKSHKLKISFIPWQKSEITRPNLQNILHGLREFGHPQLQNIV